MKRKILIAFLSLVSVASMAQNWRAAADEMSEALVKHFWGPSFPGYETRYYFNYASDLHHLGTEHYWPQAHAIDVITDAFERTGDARYAALYPQWNEGAPRYNVRESHNEADPWWNPYIDDMEWITLALLRMYEASGEKAYLENARHLFDDYIWPTWGPESEGPWYGGLTWNIHVRKSKNACSNGPGALIAARLYVLYDGLENPVNPRESYLAKAVKIYSWLKRTLLDTESGAVADNINGEGHIARRGIYTYNQGTFIGSAHLLYRLTADPQYLDDAVLASRYVMGSMTDSTGVLSDAPGGDGGLFHGIFFRYFYPLALEPAIDESVRSEFRSFILHSASVMASEGMNKRTHLYGGRWHQAPADDEAVSLTAHLTGCMLMHAAAMVSK